MRRRLEAVYSLLLVTLETDTRLLDVRTDRIGIRMDAVAARAGGIVSLMRAAGPGERDVAGMAVHADLVLLGRRGFGAFAEIFDQIVRGARDAATGMQATGSVAGLALLVRHR